MAKRRATTLPTNPVDACVELLEQVSRILELQRFELATVNRRLDALERAQRARQGHRATPRRKHPR